MRAVEEAVRTLNPDMQGTLSKDPIRNIKYLFIVTVSLAARTAVEAGIPLETAYSISDLYIQKMDTMNSIEEIRTLAGELYRSYVNEIQKARKSNTFSKPVMLCLNYIDSHFNENITLDKLAEEVNLHPSYLSSLFKKETNENLRNYLVRKRIEVAQSLLSRTEYSYTQIAASLAFCSQSYFTKMFKLHTGYTPKQYRMKFYDTNFTREF